MTVLVSQYPDRETMMGMLSDLVMDQLAEALGQKGQANLAVPGGTTPGPFLEMLSNAPLDWANIHVMLTDERFVPESSDRSNTRLLRETLLRNNAATAQLVPFYRQAEKPEEVVGELAESLGACLPLDVCVLGMGADMHTASIFPGADRLADALDRDSGHVILPMRAPGAPEPRLTLTAPILRAAKNIHVLIAGAEKKAALETAFLEGPDEEAPIRTILSAPTEVEIHYAD